MSEEIPYKVYRAKVKTTKDANANNKTTTWNAQTGFTTNRGSLTVVHKSLPAVANVPSTNFNNMQQQLPKEKEEKSAVQLLEEFKSEKNEREEELQQQIQKALNNNTTLKPKPAIELVTETPLPLTASTEENRTFARCKSDITQRTQASATTRESARATYRTQPRNRSQSTEETKRKPHQVSNAPTRKKRSQSAVTMNTAQKTAQEKEAIKKRLEELRQNTRKILSKNLQKKQKNQLKESLKEQVTVKQKEEPVVLGSMSFRRPTPRVKKPKEIQATNEEEQKVDKADKSARLQAQPEKRIGLLRKPEYKDHSYSALKDIEFNKENCLTNQNSPERTVRLASHKKPLPTTLSPAPATVIATKNVNVQVNGSSLVSSARLESEVTSAGRMLQASTKRDCLQQEHTSDLKADLPYWLRPTSVQIYPYNFIKAVRRKLEAVTSLKPANLETAHVATSTSALQEVPKQNQTPSLCNSKQKSISLQSLSIKPLPPVRSNSCSSAKQLQSLESSNFSSISIQLPASNTVSEVSSLASEVHDSVAHSKVELKLPSPSHDDDTTVSSSILSNVEVDVKNVNPLNLDKIDKFHIESKSEIENKEKQISAPSTKTIEKPIDLDKFLQDFNRSLSQVIQVNAQLKSTLDKSHAIYKSKNDENLPSNGKSQEAPISTEYENDVFTQISSSLSSREKNKAESAVIESASNMSNSSGHSKSLHVLSPTSINNSYERSLRSNSAKTSPEQNIEKSEAEVRREKRRQLRESLMETNVNMKRGDFQSTSEEILTEKPHDFVGLVNGEKVKKLEKPETKTTAPVCMDSTLNLSEDSTNFNNNSVYEKLLQKGVSKEDCLRACLKIREKFILDRTKSQIALLEIQKERFKSQGLLEQIAAIKKKQRGILLKMEREREEIQRLLQTKSSHSTTSTHSSALRKRRETSKEVTLLAHNQPSDHTELLPERSPPLGNSTALERLLQKREADLQRRRDYVERLLQRHRRLDEEEIELQHLEQKLLKYNHETLREKQQQEDILKKFAFAENSDNIHKSPAKSSSRSSTKHCLAQRTEKMERHLKEIDRSMRELRSISDVRSSNENMNNLSGDSSSVTNMETNIVRTTGCKLNKLWRRLTSQQVEKYEPNRRYKLCKADVERLYEEAKFVVLNKFAQNKTLLASELFDKSIAGSVKLSDQKENGEERSTVNGVDTMEEDLEESAEESVAEGNYHPSVAEENFNLRALSCTSTSSSSYVETPYTSTERKRIVEENVEKFLLLTNQVLVKHVSLERSSSDTQLSERALSVKSSSPEVTNGKSPVEESMNVVEEILTETCNTINTTPNVEICTDLQENNESPKSTNYTITESQMVVADEEEIALTEETNNNFSINNRETNSTPEISTLVESAVEQSTEGSTTTKVPEAAAISCALEEEIYSADFETSVDETRIEDISAPIYETTFDTTREENETRERRNSIEEIEHNEATRVIPIVNKPSNIVPCLPFATSPSTSANAAQANTIATTTTNNNNSENGTQLMPDIINELEIRRCQQIILENDQLKNYEHVTAMPYVFVREIPNKPPPPYVPPAHGSPMTTIFPSEERIKDITYRRTHELYCQMLKTDYVNESGEKLPSVLEDKITNIYERIILDICCEYLKDNREVLVQGDPAHFHRQLAFFNPPDRLRCLQESIHREVRRCLAMDKSTVKRSQIYSVYGQRAKRDHIDKIIIQELYDDDEKWCNFQHEEQEVLELMVEEMVNKYLRQLVTEVYLEECPAVVLDEETQPDTTLTEPEIPSETPTTAQD